MQAVNTKGAAEKRGGAVKRLLVVIIAATLAYGGWWFYAAHTMRTGADAWFADQRAAGWQADYADLTVRGFPNRTDLTVLDPVLVAPDAAYGWRAPFLQVLRLSYSSGHVIVAWPDDQTISTTDGDIAVTSDGLRASVIFENDNIFRSNLEAAVLNLAGPQQAIAMAGVNLALEKIDASAARYRLAISVGDIAAAAPKGSPEAASDLRASLRADMDVTFDQALTTGGVAQATPRPTEITLRRSEIGYGTLVIKVTGTATLDRHGQATGEITVLAENWRAGIDAARQSGDLPPDAAEVLVNLLSLLATLNGSRDSLDVTLGLDRGTLLLGPIPVGRIPPLNWP